MSVLMDPLPLRSLFDTMRRATQGTMSRHTFCVTITERRVTHVRKLDVTLRTRVHEQVTMLWMELSGGNDLREFLHIDRFDVYDI